MKKIELNGDLTTNATTAYDKIPAHDRRSWLYIYKRWAGAEQNHINTTDGIRSHNEMQFGLSLDARGSNCPAHRQIASPAR